MTETQTTQKLSLRNCTMKKLQEILRELLRSFSSEKDFKTSCKEVFDNPTVTVFFWEGSCRSASVCCDGYIQEIKVNVG